MKTTLNALHHQGNDWKRDLDFYVDELAILTKRLEAVDSKKHTPKEAQKAAAFLKKFVKIREKADALKVAINARQKKVESIAKDKPGSLDDKLKPVSDKLHQRVTELAASVAATR